MILSLTDRRMKFSTPFELSEHIENMLKAQASQAGARALSWRLSDFDRVGGKNTLRMIWSSLKSELRVEGRKRKILEDDEDPNTELGCCGSSKRMCMSLDLSGTCSKMEGLGLGLDTSSSYCSVLRTSSESGSSLNVSRLLEETDDRGEVERLIREAGELLVEIREEFPEIVSSSESSALDSDSGTSEVQWGGVETAPVLGPNGRLVPVTVGESSSNESAYESNYVRRQLCLQTDSSDNWSDPPVETTSSGASLSSESAEDYREEGWIDWYLDDIRVHQVRREASSTSNDEDVQQVHSSEPSTSTEGHVLDETSSASDANCVLTNASDVGDDLTCASTGGEGYKSDGPKVLTNASNVGGDLTCASSGEEDYKDDGSACALTNASNVGNDLTCASTGGGSYKVDGPNVLTNASNVGDDLTCASTGGEDCKDDGSSGCLPKDNSSSTELLSSNESYMIPARVGVSNGGGRGGGTLSPVGQHGHIVQVCLDVDAQNQLFSSDEELIEMGPERIVVSGMVKDMSNDKCVE